MEEIEDRDIPVLEEIGEPSKKEREENERGREGKEPIGMVTHFYTGINVAVVELTGGIRVGDRISIEGPATNFEQKVQSIEAEHKRLQECEAGKSIGLKVEERVREGDMVYKLS
jgi:putative protease